jgi:hypothetical protein
VPDIVGAGDAVHGQDAWPDGLVPAAGVDVLVDARQAEGLAGPGEYAGAVGYQILDAGARGGDVVEDFDDETVCRQRGGRPLQALRGRRVGEQCCRNRGSHGASWMVCSSQRDDDTTRRNVTRQAGLTVGWAVSSDW